jgi:hypothetical protein
MNTEEIQKIEKYFTKYSDKDYVDCMTKSEPVIGHYYHSEEDNFYIVIFKDQRVYQLNSDHDTQGIELVDYDKLVERFESFTGERID